jgi:ethanolamine ammonia-lyase large subunit
MQEVRQRGVPLAEGFGALPWEMVAERDREIRAVYADAKKCIWAGLPQGFIDKLPKAIMLSTTSADRTDYILHPQTGEILDAASLVALREYRQQQKKPSPVQLIVSDGLNAYSLTDDGNLLPYLEALRAELANRGIPAAPEILVVRNGRVRVGYRIGELLFSEAVDSDVHRAIVHIIGERPGSMHHTFSAYITAPTIRTWNVARRTDHQFTQVVSGIAANALSPREAAALAAKIVRSLFTASAA